MKRSAMFALGALVATVGGVRAQTTRATESRFYPFVGCWGSDSTSGDRAREALSCVVPVASSSDVEIIDLLDGKVANRRRVDGTGRPVGVDQQGCRGQEQASWSPQPRRIYLHSEFICEPNGIAGGTTTLMSILSSGERLDVERIRSGVGSITRVERLRDAGVPASVPREIASRLGKQRLAVMTSRAEAAAPLQTSDVVEALHHTDSAVVRAWLVATAQRFQLSGDEVASLVRADVPSPVLQAMMGAAPSYQLGVGVDASGRSTDAYLSAPGTPGGGVTQMTTAAPPAGYENVYVYDGCCAAPPGYSAYNYYVPGAGPTYYPAYVAPYAYYAPYLYQREYPVYRGPIGGGVHRPAPTPSYYSNPVGVRQGQSGAPRGVPSRRRP